MKKIISLLLCTISLTIHAQQADFDGHKWVPPYSLATPKDWGIERFPVPISFAPQLNYRGVEDIRFAPGWAKLNTEEYWTYAFLWWLDGTPETNAPIIAANLKAYYTGLIEANREGHKLPVEKIIPVVTAFKEIFTDKGDLKTFTGTIEMTDYMQGQPITLNCIVHLRRCPEQNRTILFYQLSPKPFTHSNWQALGHLWRSFKCKKD